MLHRQLGVVKKVSSVVSLCVVRVLHYYFVSLVHLVENDMSFVVIGKIS